MIVVDASILANAFADFGVAGTVARERLFGEDVAVPDLAYVETLSVLRKQWLLGNIAESEFRQAVTLLGDAPFTRYPSASLLPGGYRLRHNVSAYDAMYVALAEALDCTLVTGDSRLAAAVDAGGAQCAVELLED